MISRHEQTRFSTEDAARLHMSMAGNPMLVTGLALLERPIHFDELVSRLDERLASHRRLRQLVIEPRFGVGMPRWREDPSFDVLHHVHHIDLALMPRRPPLDEVVGDLSTIPLSRGRPLWRVHLIDGPQPAVMFVIHHALTEGAALPALVRMLVDEETRAPQASRERTPTLRGRARVLAAGTVAAVKLATRRADPTTRLKGSMSERKQLAFSSALPLEELESTARAMRASVTELLLAAVTGACRAELSRDASADGLILHALVPVGFGDDEPAPDRDGADIVELPVGTADLGARLHHIRRTAGALRSRGAARRPGEGASGARIATAAGALSAMLQRASVTFFSRRASVVVSTVRGPASPQRLCGAAVRDLFVWAPAAGTITLSVTLVTYAGHARIGVAADARTVGSARRVVAELESELDNMRTFASSARA